MIQNRSKNKQIRKKSIFKLLKLEGPQNLKTLKILKHSKFKKPQNKKFENDSKSIKK